MTLTEPMIRSRQAADVYGTAWLNGEPYAIRRGDGDVVLVDFWSSTCVHCLADLRHINRWQEMYADAGLVVVGVHSPEYEFAHAASHVERTIQEYGLAYRVVLDNKGTIRSAYGVQDLPTKALIDRNGVVRYILHGRREFVEFERAIQFLIRESGFHGDLPSLLDAVGDLGRPPEEVDVELRCGYLRGSTGNIEGYAPESLQNYTDPGSKIPGRLYLIGPWLSRRESFRCTTGDGGNPFVRFVMGTGDLYIVASAPPDSCADIEVELNGEPVPKLHWGADVRKGPDRNATIALGEPRAYHLLHGLVEQMNEVVLRPRNGEVDLFQVSMLGAGDMRAIFPN